MKAKLYLLIIGAVMAIPFLFQMLATFFNSSQQMNRWWQLGIATLVQFFLGMELYQRAALSWRKRTLTADLFLVIVLTIVYFYNAAVVFNGWTLPVYFEVNVLTIVFTLFGSWLLEKSRQGTEVFSDALSRTLMDKLVQIYLSIIVVISLLALAGWGLMDHWPRGLLTAFDIWIIACPSALGLAVPTSFVVGKAVAKRVGSLFQLELSQEIYRKIKKNLIFAFGFPLIGIPFAAFGWLNPLLVNTTILMSVFAIMVNTLLLYLWLPKNIQGT